MFDFGFGRSRPTFGPKEKSALYAGQKGRYNGCRLKLPMRNLTVDHIRPFSRGGGERLTNLQLLCSSCNSMKGDGTMSQLRKKLQAKGITKAPKAAAAKRAPAKKKTPSRRPKRDPFFDW